MRVAFLGGRLINPDNPRAWSGLPFFMRRALEDAGVETITLAPEDTGDSKRWARFLYWRWFHRKRYLIYCDTELLQSHARQFERRLAAISVDAVFSPSTWPIAFLETELPVVFWTDACFAGLLEYYESFSNLAPPSVATGHAVEQRALERCTRAVYSADWAARTARASYRIDPAKIVMVPFGGNLQEPPTLEEAREIVCRRPASPVHLLLVGVDWKRKGADLAVETFERLVAAGVDCRLTIVGCSPPASRALPPGVTILPFINKSKIEDRRRLNELYARSHFFIMPTRAEAFGIVYAEATAFGVPCLGTQVGGLPSVVREGVNGHLFPLDAGADEYASWILGLINSPSRYRRLALRAVDEGATRLSWKVAGRRMAEVIADAVRPRVPSAAKLEAAAS